MTIDHLRRTSLFAAFPDEPLQWLGERADEVACPGEVRIMVEGESTDALCVVLEGELQASRGAAGREFVLALGDTRIDVWLPRHVRDRRPF